MTPSSIVAALVVTVLLGISIWWRDEQGRVERSTRALSLQSAVHRAPGQVVALPTARPLSPEVDAPAAVSPPAVPPPAVPPPAVPPPAVPPPAVPPAAIQIIPFDDAPGDAGAAEARR